MLDILDYLIQLSADRYMDLDDINEICIEDKQDYKPYLVHPDDIVRAKELASSLLLRMISGEMILDDDKDEDRMERSSRLLAHMAGRGGNDLGFKTWGAAPMMAKKLLQQRILGDISESTVLELGTGTGMVGLVCDYLGAGEIHVTDYHPRVLDNVAYNIKLNESHAKVSKLDFIEVAKDESPEWKNLKFDIVIASDLLYEMEHADYLPVAVNKLMKDVFYFMIPLRDTHWREVAHFESRMQEMGLIVMETMDIGREEEEGFVKFRYYRYNRLE
ncbi:putative methyltransferase-domain-containing protein [Pilobolus umbonatus]|nr:putative methyltransferase-domain-containing protein [Pilobolus umbonatus]